ncbi:MAG: hypothetical protein ABEN55_12265 [Bradymonadaceae bacterium]
MTDSTDRGRRPRGSALIVVLLVLLVLSALGLMALRTVGNSLDHSGTYRVRATADDFSGAAARYIVNDTPRYAGTLAKTSKDDMSGQSFSTRKQLASRGGYVHLVQESTDPDGSTPERALEELTGVSSNESGLLTDSNGTNESFERMNAESKFEIMMRNPSHRISLPGFSDDFCFRKVTVASRSRLGRFDPSWKQPARIGQGTTITEGFVPQTNCGN